MEDKNKTKMMKKEQYEKLMYALWRNHQLFIPQGQTISEWIDKSFDSMVNQNKVITW